MKNIFVYLIDSCWWVSRWDLPTTEKWYRLKNKTKDCYICKIPKCSLDEEVCCTVKDSEGNNCFIIRKYSDIIKEKGVFTQPWILARF